MANRNQRKNKSKKGFKPAKLLFKVIIVTSIITGSVGYLIIKNAEQQLPGVTVLKDIQLQTPLRIFSADNKLMAEFGEKRRIPTSLENIPKDLINAVIATEDSRFYEHSGVDLIGLGRAALKLIVSGDKLQGGSTITMQVARNFFLSREKTYLRKVNEILLAKKIEQELSKDEILLLYLNKIFFGYRSYGVAAAAKTYYGKDLMQLTLAESAMLAGLPKAPSAVNPISNPSAAIARRDHVLSRMLYYGYISEEEYRKAINQPDNAIKHDVSVELYAPYVTEMVRQALVKRWGDDVYTAGLQIHTTIDSRLQNYANNATRSAIIKYEQRHGYNGPIDNWGEPIKANLESWPRKLRELPRVGDLETAVVIQINDDTNNSIVNNSADLQDSNQDSQNSNQASNQIKVLTSNSELVTIPWDGLSWARRKSKDSNLLGKKPNLASDVVKIGDVIKIWRDTDFNNTNNTKWVLSQAPEIEAALVSIDPKTGKLLALTGGYDFNKSNFNRITQAFRQAGSSLKPFIYSAALEKGLTTASVFNDAPIVIDDPEQEALWRPQNSTQEFYGPTSLRTALVKSRNLVSIRLLQEIGIDYAHDFLQRFGFNTEQIPNSLSLALGTASVTPLQLAQGFSSFANGGYAIAPVLISQISNGNNQTLYQLQETSTNQNLENDFLNTAENINFEFSALPAENSTNQETKNNNFKQIIPPQNAYLINNILQDAVKYGTSKKALELNRADIAGKTGTSNDNLDAWYCGFNPALVTITWMGYDQPKSISEYAASTALPMWMDFMGKALSDKPEEFLPMPNGIVSVRIDPKTGLLADSKQKDSILELFKSGTEPTEISSISLDSNNNTKNSSNNSTAEQIF